jgi:hypothetical protein
MNRTFPLSRYVLLLSAIVFSIDAGAESVPDFTREVRPILSTYCFKCHGPDEKARKAELRLDSREAAMKEAESGEKAVVPGNPDASELVRRILSDDRDEIMPPPSTKHELTEQQKDILKRWVKGGAEYVPHWAFAAPKGVEPPTVVRSAAVRSWTRRG